MTPSLDSTNLFAVDDTNKNKEGSLKRFALHKSNNNKRTTCTTQRDLEKSRINKYIRLLAPPRLRFHNCRVPLGEG